MTPMTASDVIRPPVGERSHDNCLVHAAHEIRSHLQRLLEARSVLVGRAHDTAPTQVTALLHVGESTLLIDVPRTQATLREWLDSPRLQFESSVQRISLSFATGPAWLDQHEGRPALGLPIPNRLRYEQRREYLRVAPPTGSLRCQVPTRGVDDELAWVEATIRDIGGGGVAMLVSADAIKLTVGDILEGCVIELPQAERMTVTLLVRHLFARTGHGPPVLQAGCEFLELPRVAQDKLFRYLMQLDRERVSRRRAWE